MQRIRMGMVGGGEGAFIGAIHRMAAALDGEVELVCGAFSQSPDKAQRSATTLGIPTDRGYPDYITMLDTEAARPDDQRMQFVAIVTPNDTHFPIASAALARGFHVLSDKPATLDFQQARALAQAVRESGLCYGITHTYTGYPMVREARARIKAGELGGIRKVLVDYSQGWLANHGEEITNKQAQWRLDPERAGASCCMGDIGVHAANLAEYVSGQQITALCSDLRAAVSGRALDDDGAALLKFDGGARGVLNASQIATGEENNLVIRVYGERGGLEWRQQEPNTLWLRWPDQPHQQLRAGAEYLSAGAQTATRTPMGHPEGYIEAFANIYREFAARVRSHNNQRIPPEEASDLPGIAMALRGMAFIETAVNASLSEQKWHDIPTLEDSH